MIRQKIAVLGAGSWGTALAMCLVENGHNVILWGNDEIIVNDINEHHRNEKYLKQIQLPKTLHATTHLQKAIANSQVILFAVPTNAMRSVAKQVSPHLTHQPYIVHAGKGLEQGTYMRISQVLAEELREDTYKDIIVLSGPSHAEEVAKKDLTSITAASSNEEAATYIQQLFMNLYFRVYTNKDIIGVELGAALKNIIAIGAGILHGLDYGDNAKAALITRGLAEITRFGKCYGANPLTFSGLSGVGDLIVTCTSPHSRNWKLGYLLGTGIHFETALTDINMVVEGALTVKVAYELSIEKNIDLPITTAIYQVLYTNKDVKTAILELMMRDGKSEQSNISH